MRKVYAYAHISEIQDAPFYPHLRNLPQLAVTRDFMDRMKEAGLFPNTFVFRDLSDRICKSWSKSESRVSGMIHISHIINSMKADAPHNEKLWLTGVLKRVYELWSALVLLEEAGITEDDINSDDPNIILLKKVWATLIREETDFKEFRTRMESKEVIEEIRQYINSNLDGFLGTIVIHGFYFFTPLQERIIRLLEEAGYDVVFLIPYDERYPRANSIWEQLYCSENGFEDKCDWTMYPGTRGNVFGELMECHPVDSSCFELKEYGNVMDFVEDIGRYDPRSFTLYSPSAVASNELLGDFFPERYGKRTILSYPVGRFIMNLHSMWDPETSSLMFDDDLVGECIASGWIRHNGHSSREFLRSYDKVRPFFKGCKTVDEWNRRLRLLHEIDTDVVSNFRSRSVDPSIKRREEILNNPFSNFSMFDLEPKDLDAVVSILGRLMECAELLFSTSGNRISDHVSRLEQILSEQTDESEIQSLELDVAGKVLEKIRCNRNQEVFKNSDLSAAIRSYLSNEFSDHGPDNPDSRAWVHQMYEIVGNTSDHLHICLSDASNLPGSGNGLVWPLTEDLLDDLYRIQLGRDPMPPIGDTMFIVSRSVESNRYLVYQAFESKKITLSWIDEIDSKRYVPSPYIRLLSQMSSADIRYVHSANISKGLVEECDSSSYSVSKVSVMDFDPVPEMIADYAICPRRFLYGYVLNNNPSYSSDFHQSFTIGALIGAISKTQCRGGFDRKHITDNVMALFPYLSDVEKRNIEDRAPRPGEESFTRYNDRRYTDLRLDVDFPKPIRGLMERNMSSIDFRIRIDLTEDRADPEVCKYCPHIGYCPHALFSGDGD